VHAYLGGIPEGWTVPLPAHVYLGGEGRVAAVEVQAVEEGAISSLLPSCPSLEPDPDGIVRFTLTLLTPGYYADPVVAVREGPPGVPGECVSACLGKLRQVGGWNLKEHGPRPLEPVIPPGSTWFYAAAPGDIDRIVALHGGCLGNKSEYGYGQVVVGRWTEMASAEPVG
jgi:CRISPR-associated protein Cmr3